MVLIVVWLRFTFAILNNLILKKKLKNKNIFLFLTGTGYKDLGIV